MATRSAMILTVIFIVALVISPAITFTDAARPTTFKEVLGRRPICPACVCCEPPPPGSCCRCRCGAGPVTTQSHEASPP
nr:uncharacterized protein LOC111402684 [Ipomoea batatas]GMC77488.1 uncharacterized protein LOC111402684 [Ipomoea batatas]GMC78168.1 uncharacterized protein LOC111402684 [Ipomoea batatas]